MVRRRFTRSRCTPDQFNRSSPARSATCIHRSDSTPTTPSMRPRSTTRMSGRSTRRTERGPTPAISETRSSSSSTGRTRSRKRSASNRGGRLSPVSDVEWELDAPDGIELLLATNFPRATTVLDSRRSSKRAGSLPTTSSCATPVSHDFDRLTVRVYNDADKRHIPRRDIYSFADSDVWGWRVNVTEGEPDKGGGDGPVGLDRGRRNVSVFERGERISGRLGTLLPATCREIVPVERIGPVRFCSAFVRLRSNATRAGLV